MAHNVKLDGLTIENLKSLIEDANKALASRVDGERQELLKKLAELDAISKPARSAPASSSGGQRSSPKPKYRTPDGQTWSGRGGIPRFFKDIGVKSKADMDKYLIKD